MLLEVQCGWTRCDGKRRLVCCLGCNVDGRGMTVSDVWCVVGGCSVEGRGMTVSDVWCVVRGVVWIVSA